MSRENQIEELFHYIRAIKFYPDIISLREQYFSRFHHYLTLNAENWLMPELEAYEKEGILSRFVKQWKTITAKYRPIEQALDYASQMIYEAMIEKNIPR